MNEEFEEYIVKAMEKRKKSLTEYMHEHYPEPEGGWPPPPPPTLRQRINDRRERLALWIAPWMRT